eukprot:Platyproteum_vivax@DN3925_c0_g1_i2.p1
MIRRVAAPLAALRSACNSQLIVTAETRGFSSKNNVDSSKLQINKKTSRIGELPDLDSLKFGKCFSDHMLEIDWSKENGWDVPVIKEMQPIALHPASSCLHYAIECFEGMKCFLDENAQMLLFRPEMNMQRLKASCQRVCLPDFDAEEVLKCIEELLRIDSKMIPDRENFSMYIRPTVISTEPTRPY